MAHYFTMLYWLVIQLHDHIAETKILQWLQANQGVQLHSLVSSSAILILGRVVANPEMYIII